MMLAGVALAAEDEIVRVRILSRFHPMEITVEAAQGKATTLNENSAYPIRFRSEPRYRIDIPGRGETRFYTGALEAWWQDGEIVLVNHAPLEDYVAGVVVAEMGSGHPAAMRAQAVIARTWALRHKDEKAEYSFGDLANHQVFHGFSMRAEQAAEIIEATRGMVLTYDGRPIDAVFHAACADRVYSAHEIWGGRDHGYLRAVTLPDVIASTAGRGWIRRLPRERVDPLFQSATGQRPEYRIGRRDGQLGVHVIPGEWIGIDRFRLIIERALGWNTLRSNAFTITTSNDELVFRGEGFGHLVGLCQSQAVELAEQGWSFEEILRLFYPGTRLGSKDKR